MALTAERNGFSLPTLFYQKESRLLFEKPIVKSVMGYLLLADVLLARDGVGGDFGGAGVSQKEGSQNPGVDQNGNQITETASSPHLLEVFSLGGSFHGGLLNRGFDVWQSKLLQVVLYTHSKTTKALDWSGKTGEAKM